jgi:ABC-2 type transport system permease protein
MFTLIKNEIIKILRRKKTLVITIGFIALVALICFSSFKESQNNKRWNSPEARVEQLQSQIDYMKKQPPDTDSNKDSTNNTKDQNDTQLASLQVELKQAKDRMSPNWDWKASVKESIEANKNIIANMKPSQNQQEQLTQADEKTNIQNDITVSQYRLDHNIKPTENYELNSFKNFDTTIVILGTIFLVIGLLAFSSDMISGEYTPPTMKLLLTQPVSRAKVLLSKYIASLLSTLFLIILIEGIAFLIMGLIFGFGNPLEPTMIGARYKWVAAQNGASGNTLSLISGSSHMVPVWKYSLICLGLETLYITACVSFAFLVSTIFMSSMISMVSGIMFTIVIFVLQAFSFVRNIAPYIFIYHGNSSALLKGDMARQFNSPNITIQHSILVMLVWIVLCYVISHFVFTKKDILI